MSKFPCEKLILIKSYSRLKLHNLNRPVAMVTTTLMLQSLCTGNTIELTFDYNVFPIWNLGHFDQQ